MARSALYLATAFLFCQALSTGTNAVAQDNQPAVTADSLIKPELDRLTRTYHLDAATLAACDKIITFDREVYVGKVEHITFAEVRYVSATDKAVHLINRSRISQILYAGGRRDVFIALDDPRVQQQELVDSGRIIVKNMSDWMKVRVTENPEEVNSLLALGVVKTRYEGERGNMDNEELMRHAAVSLKKKAAAMRAHYVLIETKFFNKPYGELPVVEVTGRVYGYR
jgi:hypothetical protein